MNNHKGNHARISIEEAREAINARRYDLAGVYQLDEAEVLQLLDHFEEVEYLPLADFLKLLADAERQLGHRLQHLGSAYATGIPMQMARVVVLSLLRILPAQRQITDPPTDKAQTEEEMEQFRKSVRAAAKVAGEVQRVLDKTGEPPSLEAVNRLIEQEAKEKSANEEHVRSHLQAAREGAPPVILGDNNQLPAVAQMPKALHSELRHQVITTVKGLIDPDTDVELTVTAMMHGVDVPVALQDLIDKPVRARFISDRKGKMRRALLSAQLTETPLSMTVEIDRAFRPSDWRHNTLTICKLHSNPELIAAVVEVSSQLQLDLGSQ